jgi:oligoribonuclease (3'-5' exoribonuclease)
MGFHEHGNKLTASTPANSCTNHKTLHTGNSLSVNVTKFQNGVSNLGAKVFNMLPSYIKIESDNLKKFKLVLQKFLYENSIYSLDEYFHFRKLNVNKHHSFFDT